MKRLLSGIAVLSCIFSLLFFGCSSEPKEQQKLAENAMQQAKEQHAEELAATDWKLARQAWEDAQSLIAKQKFAEAGTLLLRAKSRFEKARDIAKAKRDDLRRDIDGKQKTIEIRYGNLKDSMSSTRLPAPVKKGLDESCREIDKALDKMKAELEQGDYTQAQNTAMLTLRQVYEAEKEVEKAGRKK